MIVGYAQGGCVDESVELFVEIPKWKNEDWFLGIMTTGRTQNGNNDKALELFEHMP